MTKQTEYPYPVLHNHTNDYPNCSFDIHRQLIDDSNMSVITLELDCQVVCNGLVGKIASNEAVARLELKCLSTSLYKLYPLDLSSGREIKTITIAKEDVRDSLELRAMIIAVQDLKKFRLPEWNQKIFADYEFDIPRGGLLAYTPELNITLSSYPIKDIESIVKILDDPEAESISLRIPQPDDMDVSDPNFIWLTLTRHDFENWLETEGRGEIEKVAQAAILHGVITEAVGKLRQELQFDLETSYRKTIWGKSIFQAMKEKGMDHLSTNRDSDWVIAYKLLGNITSGALDSLMRLMQSEV